MEEHQQEIWGMLHNSSSFNNKKKCTYANCNALSQNLATLSEGWREEIPREGFVKQITNQPTSHCPVWHCAGLQITLGQWICLLPGVHRSKLAQIWAFFSPQRRSRTRCRPRRAKDPRGASAPRPQRGEDTGRLGRAPNLPPRRGPRCLFSHRFNAQQPKSRQLPAAARGRAALGASPSTRAAFRWLRFPSRGGGEEPRNTISVAICRSLKQWNCIVEIYLSLRFTTGALGGCI